MAERWGSEHALSPAQDAKLRAVQEEILTKFAPRMDAPRVTYDECEEAITLEWTRRNRTLGLQVFSSGQAFWYYTQHVIEWTVGSPAPSVDEPSTPFFGLVYLFEEEEQDK